MRFEFDRDPAFQQQYVVKKGDTLYTIAKEYGVTVDELLVVNGLTTAVIYPNQILIIPLNNNGDKYFVEYVVKDNDTLESIANKYNVSVTELMNYNNLDKLYLKSDQVIKIPAKRKTHKVVSTDSIDKILGMYDMTLQELVDLNLDRILVKDSYLYVK